MPGKLRIESKDGDGNLRLLLISADDRATEFRAWRNEYTQFFAAGMNLSFSPDRGIGLGEMLYDTIADGITRTSIRGREKLRIGQDLVSCVVVDVEYRTGTTAPKYSFWIAEETALILRRAVKYWDGEEEQTLVSWITALTVNENISTATFEFTPPPGAKNVLANL
jgi:hypothetical protein